MEVGGARSSGFRGVDEGFINVEDQEDASEVITHICVVNGSSK